MGTNNDLFQSKVYSELTGAAASLGLGADIDPQHHQGTIHLAQSFIESKAGQNFLQFLGAQGKTDSTVGDMLQADMTGGTQIDVSSKKQNAGTVAGLTAAMKAAKEGKSPDDIADAYLSAQQKATRDQLQAIRADDKGPHATQAPAATAPDMPPGLNRQGARQPATVLQTAHADAVGAHVGQGDAPAHVQTYQPPGHHTKKQWANLAKFD